MVDLSKHFKNSIFIDWLTFSSKLFDENSIIKFLGMSGITWKHEFGSKLRYQKRMIFQHIQIHYTDSVSENKYNPGVCVEMSGQGCREFESFSNIDWSVLLRSICSLDQYNVSRIDFAYDDFDNLLPMFQIVKQAQNFEFTSRSSHLEIMSSADILDSSRLGWSVVHGKRGSNCMIRIYDKRVERRRWDLPHWIRCEIQLRNEGALNAVGLWLDSAAGLGALFGGVVRRYVQYRDCSNSSTDSNKSRWPLSPWYEKFLSGCGQISVYSSKGTEYNKMGMDRYAYQQNHNHTLCELMTDGLLLYLRALFDHEDAMPDKYKKVMNDYFGHLRSEASQEAFQAVFEMGGSAEDCAAAASEIKKIPLPSTDKPKLSDFIRSQISDLESYLYQVECSEAALQIRI